MYEVLLFTSSDMGSHEPGVSLSSGFDLQAPFPDHSGVGHLYEVGQCDSMAQTEHDVIK